MTGLYGEDPLGEGQLSPVPGLEKFRKGGELCQLYSVTDKDQGMLKEPGSQGYFDMLNRYQFSHLSWEIDATFFISSMHANSSKH